MNVIGHMIVDGKPYINGKPAIWDETSSFPDIFSKWRCPECKANLSVKDLICLNACHLTVPQYQKMMQGLREASDRVNTRMARQKGQTEFANWLDDE